MQRFFHLDKNLMSKSASNNSNLNEHLSPEDLKVLCEFFELSLCSDPFRCVLDIPFIAASF